MLTLRKLAPVTVATRAMQRPLEKGRGGGWCDSFSGTSCTLLTDSSEVGCQDGPSWPASGKSTAFSISSSADFDGGIVVHSNSINVFFREMEGECEIREGKGDHAFRYSYTCREEEKKRKTGRYEGQ